VLQALQYVTYNTYARINKQAHINRVITVKKADYKTQNSISRHTGRPITDKWRVLLTSRQGSTFCQGGMARKFVTTLVNLSK